MHQVLLCLCLGVLLACATTPLTEPTTYLVQLPDGGRVEVLDWGGNGPAIVLLHGSGSTAHEWHDFAPLLAAQHRVVAITRRGGGQSSAFPDGGALEVLAKDVASVIDTLRLGRVVLVGHSFAGRELTAVGAAYPERLRGMVYFDAAYTANGASVIGRLTDTLALLLGDAPPLPPASALDERRAYFAQWYGCTYSPAALARITEGESLLDSASQARLSGIEEPTSYRGYPGPVLALRARWPLPGTPKAFLHDTAKTPLILRIQAVLDTVWATLRAEVPQAQYTEIPDASHCIHASQPQLAAEAILRFAAATAR